MASDHLTRILDLGPQFQAVQVPQKEVGDEAVVVWDAALVLAFFLLKHRQRFIQETTQVLELGAGTGAVGLVCKALGYTFLKFSGRGRRPSNHSNHATSP